MNLYDRLNEIEDSYKLNKDLKLKILCTDGVVFKGYFDGYTDALDNYPKITQIELRLFKYYGGTVSIFETGIKSIEVLEGEQNGRGALDS